MLKTIVVPNDKGLKVGEIWHDKENLLIGCGEGALKVEQIQRQGKKVMSVAELLRGYSF